MMRLRWLVPTLYIIFLMLPIYWLLNMSFKTTNEILGGFGLFPRNFTVDSYVEILTNPVWYNGYIASISYVVINTIISVTVALPAAYAFSRYRFLGDKHLFFWLLTNRMAPPAALPCRSTSSIRQSTCSTRPGLSRWHIAFSTSRWRCGFSKASCRVSRRRSTRRRISTGIRFHGSS